MKSLSIARMEALMEALQKDYSIVFPVCSGRNLIHSTPDRSAFSDAVIGGVRTVDPLKAFFFLGREKVAEGFDPAMPGASVRPFCLIGAKACDLKGFKVLDHVFSDPEFGDPTYQKLRAENLIISSDCTDALETCFCLAMGIKPYPENGFDLNLSPFDGGFLVETGSEKGGRLVEDHPELFEDAPEEAVTRRGAARAGVVELVRARIEESGPPQEDVLGDSVRSRYESGLWAEEASTCVECGACNTICPTCHCFLLYDQAKEGRTGRFRVWDSCLINDFARVAGGENPRHALWMRLRNRFEKKFDFFPKVAGIFACTGCGRCISACPGKIDIRRVLSKLVGNG